VQDDKGGKQPASSSHRQTGQVPAFQFAADQVTDLATFLHAAIFLNANRRL
jgi:hypothetical protein